MTGPSLTYPMATIDFEASSLEHDGYPIEIGIAAADNPGGNVRTWSTLIRPTSGWRYRGHWSKASQRIHGMDRNELLTGATAVQAMTKLNELLGPIGIAWCDGGSYDRAWLKSLSDAAGINPTFELCDLEAVNAIDPTIYSRALMVLGSTAAPHRAGPDAVRLLNALTKAFDSSNRSA